MRASKNIGPILLAGVMGILLGVNIHAHNSVRAADTGAASYPKDIYPDSRNRLPLPKRDDMDDYGKKVYDELMQTPEVAGGPRVSSPSL